MTMWVIPIHLHMSLSHLPKSWSLGHLENQCRRRCFGFTKTVVKWCYLHLYENGHLENMGGHLEKHGHLGLACYDPK